MYQRLVLVGHLGRDPEMRYTPSGTAVTTMSVATSRKWTDASGQLMQETAWFRVAVFGRQAETCNQYLVKGARVLVEGELVVDEKTGGPRMYTRRDGTVGTGFEMRGLLVRFLSAKDRASENGGGAAAGFATVGETNEGMTEEDLPF